MAGASASHSEGPTGVPETTQAEVQGGVQDEEADPEWEEASHIVDETSALLSELMLRARAASKKEKQVLLARKRTLESCPAYTMALRYLEDPAGERERRRQEHLGKELEDLIGEGIGLDDAKGEADAS